MTGAVEAALNPQVRSEVLANAKRGEAMTSRGWYTITFPRGNRYEGVARDIPDMLGLLAEDDIYNEFHSIVADMVKVEFDDGRRFSGDEVRAVVARHPEKEERR